jgi:hypothetical protein
MKINLPTGHPLPVSRVYKLNLQSIPDQSLAQEEHPCN